MDSNAVKAFRMQRQCLSTQAQTIEEYEALFRRMQPVPPVYFSRPGDPPTLVHRAAFDDKVVNDRLRAGRTIVKGRFMGGTVGYVYADELELYIAAYKKDIDRLTARQQRILDMLMHIGPLTCAQMKEETGFLVKEIMPDLHKLQEAFLVYEDQTDGDWDRGWYVFEREWEGVDINRYTKLEAVSRILLRFIYLNIFATTEGMKSWLRLPIRDINAAITVLEAKGAIIAATVDGEDGWMLPGDTVLVECMRRPGPKPSVFVLHRSDFLVKSQEHLLKEKFAGLEVLQYILMDGEFQGAVLGHWRQGPHDVDDIALTLPVPERLARKREILDAVALFYSPPFSFIKKYDGSPLLTTAE